MTCECSPSLTPVCISHECGQAPPLPDRCYWAKQTPDECCPSKRVCEEAISACPDGFSVAPSCSDTLCDAPCEGHPEATCLISRCGGCVAKYFDENGQRVQCEGGPVETLPECPDWSPPTCLIVLCELAECEHYPDAVCHTDYCKPCDVVFYDDLNQKLDCSVEGKVDEIECKDSSNVKHDEGETWMEGCNECTCMETGIPACRAKTCDTATCEGGYRVGERWQATCMTCECSPSLTPVCISHECGQAPPLPDRCYWAKQTPDECCPSKMVCEEAISACPEGSSVAPSCPDTLCDAPCEGHPEATCLISRCGGCVAKYFDENGQRVPCEGGPVETLPECPDWSPPTCLIVFCELAECERYPDAVCHTDYCKPCDVVFYDDHNQKLDCSVEGKVDEIECKDSSNRKHDAGETWMEGCNRCMCEETGLASCKAVKCVARDSNLPPLCQVVATEEGNCCPWRVVCYEALSECPAFFTVAHSCPDDLCIDAFCEERPHATCRISRCGGCSVKFYDENDQVVDSCSGPPISSDVICHDTGPVRTCLVSPCMTGTCESHPEAACHVDYCQPCTAIFHDKVNQELECSPSADPVPACSETEYITTPQGTQSLPRCQKSGHFSPKQCDTTGQCWCVNLDGSLAAEQLDIPPGKDFICESDPPCRRELKTNNLKRQRGDPVITDPVCSLTGWYEPAQCSPVTGECWCSEKDGTVVIGSLKQQGEPLNCNEPCLGNVDNTIPDLVCAKSYDSCPRDAFCHIPPNRTSGKCCYLPVRVMP
ncbi:cysteine-rich motor neuron 1 protein-like [Acanthaster planci]|uniref:Cysteine-rich motor neuron 1 protein-like n=1 Tax=Acanthaster planci TaxID=133434 RepID=A0A8B8A5P9_ACAPL|nr:cysteine-rich motor neuron 1 protein-like [Acanthaster planci]